VIRSQQRIPQPLVPDICTSIAVLVPAEIDFSANAATISGAEIAALKSYQ